MLTLEVTYTVSDDTLPAKSSLPVVRHAIHNDHMAADNQINRMAIWMRNVESTLFALRSDPFAHSLGVLQRWLKMLSIPLLRRLPNQRRFHHCHCHQRL